MTLSRYTWLFVGATLTLTITALGAYRGISAMSLSRAEDELQWAAEAEANADAPAAPPQPFAQVAAADSAWRAEHARYFTLEELRTRGDGRRSTREAMQDRVFAYSRKGQRGLAIAELERWVAKNRHDADALIWLARLLNDAGRTGESVTRYRQAIGASGSR